MLEREVSNMNNSKIGVIFGEDSLYGKYIRGDFKCYGDVNDENQFHSQCLIDFAHEYFPDKKIYNLLNYRYSPSAIGLYYVLDGNILILNTSSMKHGLSVDILLPKEISDIMKNKLYDIVSMLEGYSIDLCYDLSVENGIINAKENSCYDSSLRINLLDDYFGRNQKK